ncbi:PREDICTED: 3-oxo-5-alpha-steroid 4-dehydrogenase 1-like, partial [Thamnophis sirtalis]|uniref:3-oxo-5-alpha-steroid 4-dehydrogenase 1-like n=1 Tax=Thamnophis sirtalis TaxID=35019 RepID=A0A6I9YGX4_9SAUR
FSCSRSFIFPFLIRGGKSTPLFSFVSAFIFCSYNGYLQGRSLTNYAEYSSNWITEVRFILGTAAWLGGLLINMHSDNILRNLRKPGETGYKIPRGKIFKCLISLNIFAFKYLLFTFLKNLTCSESNHVFTYFFFFFFRWYLNKFEDYPRSRKILIPFIF